MTSISDEMDIDDEGYKSSEDEDFDPTTPNEDENISSDAASEIEVEACPAPLARKRGQPARAKAKIKPKKASEAEDLGFENSGDEITIQQGAQAESAAKTKRRGKIGQRDDSGGEGGFVKTRSMRAIAEGEEKKKTIQVYAEATIDIEALWHDMNQSPASPPSQAESQSHNALAATGISTDAASSSSPSSSSAALLSATNDLITITQTYTFAGQTTSETSLVPRSSAQAQLYLHSHSHAQNPGQAAASALAPTPPPPQHRLGPEGQILLTPLRRRSKWDPNPQGLVRGVLLEKLAALGAVKPASATATATADTALMPGSKAPPPRLNVVDKSKLDWAKLVDLEGSRAELDAAAKAKDAYHGRVEFLDRVEDKREAERRTARRK